MRVRRRSSTAIWRRTLDADRASVDADRAGSHLAQYRCRRFTARIIDGSDQVTVVQRYTYTISLVVLFSYPFLGTGFQTTASGPVADTSATRLTSLTTTYPGRWSRRSSPCARSACTTVERGCNGIRDLRDHIAQAVVLCREPRRPLDDEHCQVVRKIRRHREADELTGRAAQ